MSIRRGIVFVLAALILLVAALWYWALHTNSGARWVWSQAQSASNEQLHAEAIEGDLSGGLVISQFGFTSDGLSVRADAASLKVDVDLIPLQVEIVDLNVDTSTVRLTDTVSASRPTDDDPSFGELQLPLPLLFDDVELSDIRIERDGEQLYRVAHLAFSGRWDDAIAIERLQIAADELGLQGSVDLELSDRAPFRVAVDGSFGKDIFGGEASGTVDGYNFNATVELVETPYGPVTTALQGKGDFESLTAETLQIDGDGIRAAGAADISWASALTGTAALDLQTLDLSRVITEWPAKHPLSGQLRLSATEEAVVIEDSELRADGLPTVVNLNLLFDRLGSELSGHVGWRELGWPITAPTVTSHTGNIELSGTVDEWRVAGTIDVGTAHMPDGRFTVEGNGDRDSASAKIVDGRALGGKVSGSVAYRWRDEQPWSATLALANVSTTDLLPDWPARISGNVQGSGTVSPFTITVPAIDVTGRLRGEATRANGGFVYTRAFIEADNLLIQHGTSQLSLDGSTDSAEGMRFSATVSDLADYSDIGGDAAAEGRFSWHDKSLNLTATSRQLTIADQTVDNVNITLDYGETSQSLVAEGRLFDTQVGVSVLGAFDDWLQPLDSSWNGVVDVLDVDLDDAHSFSLTQPATLMVAPDRLSLGDFCAQDSTGGELCVDITRVSDGDLSLTALLKSVPLMLSEHLVNHDLVLTQSVSGRVDWHQRGSGEAEGDADLQIAAGRISSSRDPDHVLATDAGRLGFTIRNRRLLSGNLFVPLPGVGQVEGAFSVLDVRQGVNSDITGEANARMSDIRILADFAPLIDEISGSLDSAFSISGTVGEPVLTGSLQIADGDVLYSPIGLHLQEINLQGSLQNNRSFQFGGSFRAGEGRGQIVSSAEYNGAREAGLRFRVQGNNLRLVNVPELQATFAPDFEVTYDQRNLGINGSLDITSARLAPTNLSDGRVSESEDVSIVAGALPDEQADSDRVQRLEYSGTLDVTLGNSVFVELDLARASLGGAVSFEWQGDATPIADGRVSIDGSIEAFGQVLDVSEGAIRFPKVRADSPRIRVRAEREIYGNSQVKRAGILLDGDAENPSLEAYTVPMTTEERAFTLLVTGSDFDYEQGVGAVDFGTYIAPRLFVSYGIGLFDQDNVISARYDLASGFGIKASSGNKQSGVDLNYRFEN